MDTSSVSAEEAAEQEARAREKRLRDITNALLDLATGRCGRGGGMGGQPGQCVLRVVAGFVCGGMCVFVADCVHGALA